MPDRSNGMIAKMRPTLDDALSEVMLKNDPASPIPDEEGKESEPVAVPDPAPVNKIATRPAAKPGKVIPFEGILGELTAQPVLRRVKVALNSRVDDWIDSSIDDVLRRLQAQGHTVTKEDIVVQSLIRGLNLTPPEGWALK